MSKPTPELLDKLTSRGCPNCGERGVCKCTPETATATYEIIGFDLESRKALLADGVTQCDMEVSECGCGGVVTLPNGRFCVIDLKAPTLSKQ